MANRGAVPAPDSVLAEEQVIAVLRHVGATAGEGTNEGWSFPSGRLACGRVRMGAHVIEDQAEFRLWQLVNQLVKFLAQHRHSPRISPYHRLPRRAGPGGATGRYE